ncbi:MAG: GNAT family N-acetyltransferase [Myxococcota bacterium]
MELILRTPRLVLRPLAPDDVSLSIELWTDKDVVKYICEPLNKAEVEREMICTTKRSGNGSIGIWSVRDRATGESYGSVFLLPLAIEQDDTDWDLVDEAIPVEYEVEIGYVLKKTAWGKGIATEAASRLLRFAFESTDLEEIVAVIDHENTRSAKVLDKIGLEETGDRRAYATQCRGFKVSRGEWLKNASS